MNIGVRIIVNNIEFIEILYYSFIPGLTSIIILLVMKRLIK